MRTYNIFSFLVIELIFSLLIFNNYSKTLIFAQSSSESLDSLYKLFIDIKSGDDNVTTINTSTDKCGFNIVSQIKLNIDSFNNEQKEIIKTLLSRPVLQTSSVSPSGFFRIHYDVSGTNTPTYVSGWTVEQNVAEVANTLDSVYRFEVNYLGYLPPPPDNGAGGDDKYDVYIQNQGAGLYGYTEWESKVGAVNWTSFIVVDNNYTGYYSSGINGLKVTAAHEFHHGIQLGNYSVLNSSSPLRNSDVFFYELTSTSMEEFVYDDVNDYYAYMASYFIHPDKALPSQNGYNLAIWNIYLRERFGYYLIRRQWELIPNISAILAIDQSLNEMSTSFPTELNDFGVWTYFTNSRAIPGIYFEEAANYPLLTISLTIQFTPPSITIDQSIQPTANKYLKINLQSGVDFLIAIITNCDALAANENPNQLFPFTYKLFNYNEIGSIPIVNNYYYTFGVSDPAYWSIGHIFNDIAGVNEEIVNESYDLSQNYPNPFNPLTTINYQVPELSYVTMKVYNVLGNEVATLVNEEKAAGNYEVKLNASNLPSGVYFYQLHAGSFIETKKMILMK